MRVRKAVIPAAGLGVRFLPATKALPKEMLPIVDKPTIQYIVEEAVASGVEEILIITGRNKEALADHFDQAPELEEHLAAKGNEDLLREVRAISALANIFYVRQKAPLGLGHAVLCARQFVGEEPFAVLLGDDLIKSETPCLQQLAELYAEKQATVVAVQEVPDEDVNKYGIIAGAQHRERVYQIKQLVEKPALTHAPSNLAVIGRYIISPRIFPLLAATPPGAGGEIQLTDALNLLCREQPVYGLAYQGRRYDAGDKLGYLRATVEYALARPDLAEDFRAYLQTLLKRD